MPVPIAFILGLLFALSVTITLFIIVMPARKNGHLSPLLQFLHNFFHFKKLYLELILKILYLFSTCLSIFVGFFLLFSRTEYVSYGYLPHNYYASTAGFGLFLILAGPIILRICYEFFMMLILAVKSLHSINRKLDPLVNTAELVEESEPCYLYCTQCGTRYDTNEGNCPNCGLQ